MDKEPADVDTEQIEGDIRKNDTASDELMRRQLAEDEPIKKGVERVAEEVQIAVEKNYEEPSDKQGDSNSDKLKLWEDQREILKYLFKVIIPALHENVLDERIDKIILMSKEEREMAFMEPVFLANWFITGNVMPEKPLGEKIERRLAMLGTALIAIMTEDPDTCRYFDPRFLEQAADIIANMEI